MGSGTSTAPPARSRLRVHGEGSQRCPFAAASHFLDESPQGASARRGMNHRPPWPKRSMAAIPHSPGVDERLLPLRQKAPFDLDRHEPVTEGLDQPEATGSSGGVMTQLGARDPMASRQTAAWPLGGRHSPMAGSQGRSRGGADRHGYRHRPLPPAARSRAARKAEAAPAGLTAKRSAHRTQSRRAARAASG